MQVLHVAGRQRGGAASVGLRQRQRNTRAGGAHVWRQRGGFCLFCTHGVSLDSLLVRERLQFKVALPVYHSNHTRQQFGATGSCVGLFSADPAIGYSRPYLYCTFAAPDAVQSTSCTVTTPTEVAVSHLQAPHANPHANAAVQTSWFNRKHWWYDNGLQSSGVHVGAV